MSTALSRKSLTVSGQATAILNLLFLGGAPRNYAWFKVGSGLNAQAFRMPPYPPLSIWPVALARALRGEPSIVRAAVAGLDLQGSRPRDVRVCFAEIAMPETFGLDQREPVITPEQERIAYAGLEGFSLAPTAVLDQGNSLLALWAITPPVALDSESGWASYIEAQRALAVAVGGRVDEETEPLPTGQPVRGEIPTARVPAFSPLRYAVHIPGSAASGVPGRVSMTVYNPENTYPLEQVAGACAPQKKGGK